MAARNELSLFGGLGAIVEVSPPGRTVCRDGFYSTYKRGKGRCAYHGGVFAQVGKIYKTNPPGNTLCLDGSYSSLPPGRGVCSYHGGLFLQNKKAKVYKPETKEVIDLVEIEDPKSGEQVAVEEIPNIGIYRFSEYTTRKGKTGPSIEIKFYAIPEQAIRETIKGKGRFWFDRFQKLWIAWDTPDNRAIVESLPLILDGQEIPIANTATVKAFKRVCAQNKRLDIIKDQPFRKNTKRAILDCIFSNATDIVFYTEDPQGSAEQIKEVRYRQAKEAGLSIQDFIKKEWRNDSMRLYYKGEGKYEIFGILITKNLRLLPAIYQSMRLKQSNEN